MELSFLTAVALAGTAFLLGDRIVAWVPLFRRHYAPEPIVGGLTIALVFLGLRGLGVEVSIPTSGRPVDFLMGLITTNMGLHLSPRWLKKGLPLFLVFVGGGLVLYFVHLALAMPVALATGRGLEYGTLLGPFSYTGAPYNLNPPQIVPLIEPWYEGRVPRVESTAKGMMMVGVLAGPWVAAWLAGRLAKRAGEGPSKEPPTERKIGEGSLWGFGEKETALIVLVLALVAAAFLIQGWLLDRFASLQPDYLPVIVISYGLGILFRVGFDLAFGSKAFPKDPLAVLLLGPTMGFVLTYAAMSVPLHFLGDLSWWMVPAGLLAIAGSAGVAWVLFSAFARVGKRYDAAVASTAFLAITTGWGPIGMAFLRRFTGRRGPIEPMPIILPLNAFFIFPWIAVLLTRWLLGMG